MSWRLRWLRLWGYWVIYKYRLQQWVASFWSKRPTTNDTHYISFAVQNKYQEGLTWFSVECDNQYKTGRVTFDVLRCCEPDTLTVNGKNLFALNLQIPISPQYGTHFNNPDNPIEQTLARQNTGEQGTKIYGH